MPGEAGRGCSSGHGGWQGRLESWCPWDWEEFWKTEGSLFWKGPPGTLQIPPEGVGGEGREAGQDEGAEEVA